MIHAHDRYEISNSDSAELLNISKISRPSEDSLDADHFKDYSEYDAHLKSKTKQLDQSLLELRDDNLMDNNSYLDQIEGITNSCLNN